MAWVMKFLQEDLFEDQEFTADAATDRRAEVLSTKGRTQPSPRKQSVEDNKIDFVYKHQGRDGRRSATFHEPRRDGSALPWNTAAEDVSMPGQGLVLSMQRGAYTFDRPSWSLPTQQSFPPMQHTGVPRAMSLLLPAHPGGNAQPAKVQAAQQREEPVEVKEHRERLDTGSFVAAYPIGVEEHIDWTVEEVPVPASPPANSRLLQPASPSPQGGGSCLVPAPPPAVMIPAGMCVGPSVSARSSLISAPLQPGLSAPPPQSAYALSPMLSFTSSGAVQQQGGVPVASSGQQRMMQMGSPQRVAAAQPLGVAGPPSPMPMQHAGSFVASPQKVPTRRSSRVAGSDVLAVNASVAQPSSMPVATAPVLAATGGGSGCYAGKPTAAAAVPPVQTLQSWHMASPVPAFVASPKMRPNAVQLVA